ncbi:N-acetylmuramoyl-L-alanine amidase [Gallaecimonas pentaromativorans]|uniref:N-acetylmuramoyl-L-alanine amidase n=1 Tax=Gallaecimonas pentaromativorans TaxID=584787 RepID=A0A3N1P1T6_9GAMM|nr:N-acetylmuramoyl-L-alanine amidase [Gallaecimonas pentaromativorans]ROQ22415.1 N-acetylmuramoyl-L-alanine amidase [Gallaecimonas pentaromativorans]
MKRLLPGLLLWLCCLPLWANSLDEVRVWPSEAKTRVVLDMGAAPDFSYFTLKNPDRLVVDLANTQQKVKLPMAVGDSEVLTKIRNSTPKSKGGIRLVLELSRSAKAELFALAPSDGNGNRLVIDVAGKGASASAPSHSSQAQTPAPKPVPITPPAQGRDIIVAIDPGHGGHDPGSIGRHKTYEKNVTLAIAKKLQADLDRIPGIKAVLTRSADKYIGVVERADIAREKKADILVSIHADSIGSSQPRGASVWVLNTSRANRVIGKWVDEKDRHSELLGGAAEVIEDTKQEQYLAQALLDMSMDHSRSVGQDIGSLMLKELGKVTRLHKDRPQPKSLGVLTAPDIPSVLVETGFLSNPDEEKLLANSWHQGRIAGALATALKEYFTAWPPPGSLFAQQNGKVHVVRSGESLSILASRYNTSVSAIKAANGLKSNVLLVGQKLTIPSS